MAHLYMTIRRLNYYKMWRGIWNVRNIYIRYASNTCASSVHATPGVIIHLAGTAA